jgi:hypothetical protein
VDHVPLGKGIAELFEAIPGRIEVTGHEPTWRVTGGSFESVLAYAREAYDDPVVIAREDRQRWWPRVTLTVTTDPELAASAPELAAFATPEPDTETEPAAAPADDGSDTAAATLRGKHAAPVPAQRDRRAPTAATEAEPASTLEEIFASQERSRRERLGIPDQRTR